MVPPKPDVLRPFNSCLVGALCRYDRGYKQHAFNQWLLSFRKLAENSIPRFLECIGSDMPLAFPVERTAVDSDMAGTLGSDVVRKGKCTQYPVSS